MDNHVADARSVDLVASTEPAQLLLMPSDALGESLDSRSQVAYFGHYPRKAAWVMTAMTVLFDDSS